MRIYETPEKLAERIKAGRTTAARAVQKLEMNGFIEKKDDQHNKKIKKSFQIEKGKNVFSFIKRENDHSNSAALAGFSQREVETIFNLLQKIRKILKKNGNL